MGVDAGRAHPDEEVLASAEYLVDHLPGQIDGGIAGTLMSQRVNVLPTSASRSAVAVWKTVSPSGMPYSTSPRECSQSRSALDGSSALAGDTGYAELIAAINDLASLQSSKYRPPMPSSSGDAASSTEVAAPHAHALFPTASEAAGRAGCGRIPPRSARPALRARSASTPGSSTATPLIRSTNSDGMRPVLTELGQSTRGGPLGIGVRGEAEQGSATALQEPHQLPVDQRDQGSAFRPGRWVSSPPRSGQASAAP